MKKEFVHPYMPNSVPAIKKAMLAELGVDQIKDLYGSIIPDKLLYKDRLALPEPILSEAELKRHVETILNKNITTEEYSSFLGAGCYKHQVPAICDELNQRGEFLTAYCGDTYSDHGKMQAIFEYASLLGELLDVSTVSYTCFDAGQAVASSLSTALRVQAVQGTPRKKLLLPGTMNPEIYAQIKEYLRQDAELVKIPYDHLTGLMDVSVLQKFLAGGEVAAVFYENPSYLGFFEEQAAEIARLAHAHGALVIAQPEVAALGIMESPANLGADILCGDIQPLGMHIQYGGGQAGFIGCQQNLSIIQQLPTYMYGITKTEREGEYGWGRAMNFRCSHGSREKAHEYFGTETGLWCITAGIYLASMGPQGMYELGETIIKNLSYLTKALGKLPGVKAGNFSTGGFQEVVVNFNESGFTVQEINRYLLKNKIFGGLDLSTKFPELGQCALYCVSELTTKNDMDNLIMHLQQLLGGVRDGLL